jgi:uncharacterized protein YbjT (DUF2867 family)
MGIDAPGRVALIVGATGLVGSRLLQRLLDDPGYGRVVALVRAPLAIPHPKLDARVVDFDRLADVDLPRVDDVFCCLGTTLKAAGSKAAFRRVDYTYPLGVARLALDAGATQLLVVSAAGADAQSRVFYSRVKGELEAALARLPYRTFVALRPSLLVGARREFRAGERAAIAILGPLRAAIPARWRPVDASDVAEALHALAHQALRGRHVVGNAEIVRIAATARG